jgi:hypothetical protein
MKVLGMDALHIEVRPGIPIRPVSCCSRSYMDTIMGMNPSCVVTINKKQEVKEVTTDVVDEGNGGSNPWRDEQDNSDDGQVREYSSGSVTNDTWYRPCEL